jgi:hypothetical protein
MSVIEVRITASNGQFTPSKDPVTLSKSRGETIKWYNDTPENITIQFSKGTPFPDSHHPYSIGAGKHKDSGGIQVKEGTNWAYMIIAESGAMADPQVIIER